MVFFFFFIVILFSPSVILPSLLSRCTTLVMAGPVRNRVHLVEFGDGSFKLT